VKFRAIPDTWRFENGDFETFLVGQKNEQEYILIVRTYKIDRGNFATMVVYKESTVLWNVLYSKTKQDAEDMHKLMVSAIESGRVDIVEDRWVDVKAPKPDGDK